MQENMERDPGKLDLDGDFVGIRVSNNWGSPFHGVIQTRIIVSWGLSEGPELWQAHYCPVFAPYTRGQTLHHKILNPKS